MKYLLDTNIFIRSKNELPIDIYVSFWKKLSELAAQGILYSSEKVKEEILHGNDELTTWIRENLPEDFFLPIDSSVVMKYAETQNWANASPIYLPAALLTFADVADAFLVATAAAKDLVLVTYEKSDPACKKRIMIPDACAAIGVKSCDLNTAFRDLGVII